MLFNNNSDKLERNIFCHILCTNCDLNNFLKQDELEENGNIMQQIGIF